MTSNITYITELTDIDWSALKQSLAADQFDNGRSPERLRESFANSFAACFAQCDGRTIGTARALSDGVCNAYVVDVWTQSEYRRQGIATRMMQSLLEGLSGQHVYLFSDDQQKFYRSLGFTDQPTGLGLVVGTWLKSQ